MSRDGAERTASEAPAVHVDGKLDHVVCRNRLALIFGVGQPGVGQIVGGIYLVGGHGRVGRVHHDKAVVYGLQQPLGLHLVGFLFDVAEILGFSLAVAQTFLMRMEHDIVVGNATGNIVFLAKKSGLRDVADVFDVFSRFQLVAKGKRVLLAHAVKYDVCSAVAQDTLVQSVLPIVVMGESS